MANINFLPPWVETNEQPAFYDKESGTVLQQTARMYAKVNQLVRSVNEQNETIADYIQQFIDLHDYVEDYFDNLDVQEEVNNKIDALVADGTIPNIITSYCDPRLDAQDTIIANLQTTVEADAFTKMNDIRKNSYKVYNPTAIPSDFSEDIFTELEIYTNEEGNYIVDFDRSKYVNTSANTYYIAPDGSNTNDGSEAHPWLRLTTSILGVMSAGDTVVIKSGIYDRDGAIYSSHAITKGINIISDGGKVVLSNYENSYVWTLYGSNTYHTTRSGVYGVFDIRDYANGVVIPLTQLDGLDNIDTTPNSWCQVGNELYVHMKGGVQPSINNMTTTLAVSSSRIKFAPNNNNAKLYIKDITILSGNNACLELDAGNNDNIRALVEDCNFYNTTRATADGLQNKGCKSICKNVHCVNIEKDAFNYHQSGDGVQAYGVEIDCSANTCGRLYTESDYSNNGSTAHDYCKAIRFNGKYNNCSGGVVIDVNNAIGACYNCLIADSFYHSRDAEASHDAKLYLYNCYFIGSKSEYNMYTSSNAVIYQKNCSYSTTHGNIQNIV